MLSRPRGRAAFLLGVLAARLTSGCERPSRAAAQPSSTGDFSPTTLEATPTARASLQDTSVAPAADATEDVPESALAPDAGVAAVAPSPAVIVQNIGLHIGGGPNDAKTKAPFQRAIEQRFDAFTACYSLAPTEQTFTVGVDLYVARAGGNPEIRDLRTSVSEAAFSDCMRSAFSTVEFAAQRLGSTLFSYSLRFSPRPQ